ncbi:hypothetical protein B0T14DRAFT_61902 [Immersiella caudata]|uniref:Uncharacterized protein n=1 Tax=Immersiella caudata TaxID=314043 RepID=A0AA39XHP8_9PEZI|nr:hypothetical protein B0T14DRAFT_61902 [Immersiella caudata]
MRLGWEKWERQQIANCPPEAEPTGFDLQRPLPYDQTHTAHNIRKTQTRTCSQRATYLLLQLTTLLRTLCSPSIFIWMPGPRRRGHRARSRAHHQHRERKRGTQIPSFVCTSWVICTPSSQAIHASISCPPRDARPVEPRFNLWWDAARAVWQIGRALIGCSTFLHGCGATFSCCACCVRAQCGCGQFTHPSRSSTKPKLPLSSAFVPTVCGLVWE